jgi:hypothetical protein
MSASQDDGVVHLNVDSHSNHDKHGGGGTLSKTGHHHVDISPLAVNIRQNNNNTSNHNNNEAPSPTKQTS